MFRGLRDPFRDIKSSLICCEIVEDYILEPYGRKLVFMEEYTFNSCLSPEAKATAGQRHHNFQPYYSLLLLLISLH